MDHHPSCRRGRLVEPHVGELKVDVHFRHDMYQAIPVIVMVEELDTLMGVPNPEVALKAPVFDFHVFLSLPGSVGSPSI